MTGIAGIFHRNFSPISTELLQKQYEVLSQRGSAGYRFKPQNYVGFVHRKQTNQPDLLEDKSSGIERNGLAVVSDARIDNRIELFSELQIDREIILQKNDDDLILAAYEKWGRECTKKILGDFSFVIFDSTRRQLFCGRDPLGVKPFYYYFNQNQFYFGSEIKAILVDPEIPVLLNEEKIADFMLESFEDKSRTFYEGIFRLPPAHNLIVNQDSITIERYWQLDRSYEIRLKSDQEYIENYRDIFIDAVQSRVEGENSVGTMLSGGLDSSSVTCVVEHLLNQNVQKPVHTFSAIFESVPKSDERKFIQYVIDHGNYEPHFIQGDQLNPIKNIMSVLEVQDEPSYAPQLFLNRGIWTSARQVGTHILLEGLMGDNVVSHGYTYLSQLAREWKWQTLYRHLNLLAKNHENPLPLNQILSFYMWEYGIKSWVPGGVINTWRRVRRRPISTNSFSTPSYINSDFAKRINLRDRFLKQNTVATQAKSVRQKHYLELENGLIPTALEIYNIEISRFGMEARFPFLDRRLVEFCLAIPPEQKVNYGYTRWIARQAMAPYLPEQIRTRTSKGNLGWNFMRGIKDDAKLIGQIFDKADHLLAPFLNCNVIKNSLAHIHEGTAVESDAMLVFLSAVLAEWLYNQSFSNS